MIHAKLKEMVKFQDIFKTDEQHYKSKCKKVYNFSEYSLTIIFPRDLDKGYLLSKDNGDSKVIFLLN